jgi:hypothetical protein
MREQRHAFSLEFAQQLRVTEQTIDTELDHARALRRFTSVEAEHEAVGVVKIGFLRGMSESPV